MSYEFTRDNFRPRLLLCYCSQTTRVMCLATCKIGLVLTFHRHYIWKGVSPPHTHTLLHITWNTHSLSTNLTHTDTHTPVHAVYVYRTSVSQTCIKIKPLSYVWHVLLWPLVKILPAAPTPNKDISHGIVVISPSPGVRPGKIKSFTATCV